VGLAAAPAGTVPADDGLGFDEQDRPKKTTEKTCLHGDQPSVEAAEPGALHLTPNYDELLTEEDILGDQHYPRRHESDNQVEEEAKDRGHVELTPIPTTLSAADA
jgi:hypothetical protein